MKKTAIFAVVSLGVITALAWILTFAFSTAADRHAIVVSGLIAYVVQLCSFAIARTMAATNVMAGWGLGMLLRFAVLAVYALIFLKVLALPATAALVSLAAFFFVSTLIEPVMLSS
jgi:hypothetical protein